MHLNLSPFRPPPPPGIFSSLSWKGRVGWCCCVSCTPSGCITSPTPAAEPGSAEGHVFRSFPHSTNAAGTYCVSATSDTAALAGVKGSDPVASALKMLHEPDLSAPHPHGDLSLNNLSSPMVFTRQSSCGHPGASMGPAHSHSPAPSGP